ncbi:MAG: alpha/beta hydrolase fold domain-containing protein [Bacteroidetes bacterium]|nr:alpha/beta hydrolase fold domain-containing protein [Bacteroidota bacterium]
MLISSLAVLGQSSYSPRDTSFSIYSTYQKLKKDYPDIRPVWDKLPASVAEKRNLVYANLANDRPLHLDVFYPKKKKRKPCPAVLLIHGGGWMTGSKENLVPMAQQLAKAGYIAVAAEYRLSAEAPYPAGVKDLKAAVRYMRANAAEFGIDPKKIAAYGCSAGAQLATLLAATNGLTLYNGVGENSQYSADVQAVLNIDGIASFVHPEAEPEWTGKAANAWLGNYEENRERWKEASPLEHAGKGFPPIIFINSSYPRFHAGRDDLFQLLDKNGTYHEAHTFEGSPHGFWLMEPWFQPTLDYSLAFLKKFF